MFQTAFRKTAFGMLGAATLLMAVGTHSAHAHVVTDDEAGRLTLDALTAIPAPVRHVAYRHVTYRVGTAPLHLASFQGHGSHGTARARGLVHTVVYHPHAQPSPAHHGTHKGHHRT